MVTNTATGTIALSPPAATTAALAHIAVVLQNGGSRQNSRLSKGFGGNQTLSGANTFSGGFTWGNPASQSSAGIISFGSSSIGGPGSVTSGPLGTGTFTIRNSGVASGSYLQSTDSTSRTISNAIAFGGSLSFQYGRTGDLIFDGAMALGTGNRTFTIGNTNTTFSGAISNSGDINKAGAGTMILIRGYNPGYWHNECERWCVEHPNPQRAGNDNERDQRSCCCFASVAGRYFSRPTSAVATTMVPLTVAQTSPVRCGTSAESNTTAARSP